MLLLLVVVDQSVRREQRVTGNMELIYAAITRPFDDRQEFAL